METQALLDIAVEARAERDRAREHVAALQEQLTSAQSDLCKLESWEALGDDSVEVTLVGGEGAYEYPLEAIFADEFRAQQYAEWRRTVPTPDCADDGAELYTTELYTDTGRMAERMVAFWNNGVDDPALPKPAAPVDIDQDAHGRLLESVRALMGINTADASESDILRDIKECMDERESLLEHAAVLNGQSDRL